jgi:small subunit ribosomal protein S5
MYNNNRNNNRNNTPYVPEVKEFEETVVEIKRVSKSTKGGKTIRFSALLVIGDKKGKVGIGISKAPDVASAIRKAVVSAKKNMITIPLKGTTVPYSVEEKFSAARVLLKPAPPGSGIIAGGPVRIVLQAAGIKDAVAKTLGTNNKVSNVYATLKALETITKIYDMRTKETKA